MNDKAPVAAAPDLAAMRAAADALREVFLANLTFIGEVPAPTFGEEPRMRALLDRFAEAGLRACSMDGMGNVSAVFPGAAGGREFLLAAHADTIVEGTCEPDIEIRADRVVGPFVGDNSLALAALATLPMLFERVGYAPQGSVHFLAATRAQGRGNLAGAREFLSRVKMPIHSAICVESFTLGRLNYSSMGMIRAEVVCRVPDDYDWAQFGATGSVIPMSDIIGRINRIPLPRRPLTVIVIGSVEGGIAYGDIARETVLRFEARSESADILRDLLQQVEDIVEDVAAQSGVRCGLEVVARREPGGIDIGHPLVRCARSVLQGLGLAPQLYATTSMMSAFRDAGIPAITLGITTGRRLGELEEIEESADIAPVADGLAQLAGIVAALDGGAAG